MAAARKEADDRTALAEQKLGLVGQLEEENTKLKSALNEANKECSRWKKENLNLGEKMEGIARRRDDLESYLRSLAKKLFIKLEGAHFVPTDFFVSTQRMKIDLFLDRECRVLPELRGGDWADRTRFGSNQFSR